MASKKKETSSMWHCKMISIFQNCIDGLRKNVHCYILYYPIQCMLINGLRQVIRIVSSSFLLFTFIKKFQMTYPIRCSYFKVLITKIEIKNIFPFSFRFFCMNILIQNIFVVDYQEDWNCHLVAKQFFAVRLKQVRKIMRKYASYIYIPQKMLILTNHYHKNK
jgi:hypothetical protein